MLTGYFHNLGVSIINTFHCPLFWYLCTHTQRACLTFDRTSPDRITQPCYAENKNTLNPPMLCKKENATFPHIAERAFFLVSIFAPSLWGMRYQRQRQSMVQTVFLDPFKNKKDHSASCLGISGVYHVRCRSIISFLHCLLHNLRLDSCHNPMTHASKAPKDVLYLQQSRKPGLLFPGRRLTTHRQSFTLIIIVISHVFPSLDLAIDFVVHPGQTIGCFFKGEWHESRRKLCKRQCRNDMIL